MRNNVTDNIASRRSVREFRESPVPEDVIEAIVEAGRSAPSALNRQPWKFLVIADRGVIEELSLMARARIKKIYRLMPVLRLFVKGLKDQRSANAIKKTAGSPDDTVFYRAPLLIVVANDTRFNDTEADCCLAAQNMMLAAHSMGIGSCFIGRGRLIPRRNILSRLRLPAFYDTRVFVVFGYPKSPAAGGPARREGTVERIG
jgi:nitroreductase